jgi:uncharacterized protein YndB with AHSA1/START domain
MPIKKDGTGKRWVEMEVLVPGTPEQVWHAMATGAGNAAWFVKGEIEPRAGGRFQLDFGEGVTTTGDVVQWQPPHTFAYVEREWAAGAPAVATEITITARSGRECVVRMVHSLFTSSDDWDDQVEGFESGWPGFFAVLRVYLANFAGARAASFIAMTPSSEDSLAAWLQLGEALGLTGASVGERRTSSADAELWSGIVEHVHQDATQRWVVLRLDAPTAGVALVGTSNSNAFSGTDGTSVSLCRYFYGDHAETLAAEREPVWRKWLNETFGKKGGTETN